MGKKGVGKAKAAPPTPPAKVAAKAGPATADATGCATSTEVPKTWLDELTPEAREFEEAKTKEREKKALAAAAETKRQNEFKQWKEKEVQKQARSDGRDDKKWQQQVALMKKQAFQQGVLEAVDYGDGYWYVELTDASKGTVWKEVQGQYFCTHCEKHLNDSTLEAHIKSDAHTKKLAWAQPDAKAAPTPTSTPTQTAWGPAQASQPAAASGYTSAPSYTGGSNYQPEDWQLMMPDGVMKCIPCDKVIDCCHVETEAHRSRLDAWRLREANVKSGYQPPALPYLAWVLDESCGERYQKCLLCAKWVQDDTSHSGTRERPAGSKDHQKRLVNYAPGCAWYEENVTRERLKWHPELAQRGPAQRAAPTAQANPTTATAAPWATKPATATAAPWAKPPPPPTVPVLPHGWESAPDPDGSGKLYYFNRSTGESSWDPPQLPVAAAVDRTEDC